MATKGVISFDPGLVSQSVNYHGHNLLKQLVSDNAAQIHTIKLQDIDYKVFQSRSTELRNLGAGRMQEIIGFIASKSDHLLVEQHKFPKSEDTEDTNYEDRYKYQYPFEYFLNVDKNTRIQEFMNIIQVGDIIYAEVVNSFENTSYTSLKFIAYDRGKHRFLSDIKASDLKIILKNEDTVVSKPDEDKMGRWMCGTRLRVEVLSIHVVNAIPCLMVGTKGVTLKITGGEDVKLGKVLIKDLPQILSVTPNPGVRYLSDCMEKMDSYKNPQCIRAMTSKINIDLHWYPSLLSFFKGDLPENERAIILRKAQMCKWAHKSVADGVTYFKKGQHEEAFQCLNKALQIDPDNVEAFVAKGALLANLGRYEKAVEDFDKSLALNPEHLNARKYMCETLVELGKQKEESDELKEAEKCYSRCMELNEHHEVAREALNSVSRKLGPESSLIKLIKLENIKRENEYIVDLLQLEQEQDKRKMLEENPIPTITSKIPFVELEEEEEEEASRLSVEGSLSPLSQKLANQENLWSHPPPSRPIPTITSVIQSLVPPNNRMDIKMFSNQAPSWSAVDVTKPPPSVPLPARVESNFEDQNYKARVEEFLKALETRNIGERKRSKSGSTGEEQKREKNTDDKKSRSSSSSSSSDDDSRKKRKRGSRSNSSSSSNSSNSSSSRSSSSSSSSSSSDDNTKKKKRKASKKSKKTKSKKKKKNVKKKEKGKKETERKEDTEDNACAAVSDFGDLEEKLMAYYKKIETMGTTQDESKKSMTPEKKTKKKMSLSPKIESNKSEPEKFEMNKGNMTNMNKLKLHTHPAFLEDSEEETPPKGAKFPRNMKRRNEEKTKKPSPVPIKCKSKSKSRSHTRSKSRDREKRRSGTKSRRSTSKGRSSTSKGRRSTSKGRRSGTKSRSSTSKGRRSTSKGRRSTSKGRRSTSRGRRSRSRGRRSRSRGRRSESRGRSRSRSLRRKRRYSRSHSRSRGRDYRHRSRSGSRHRAYRRSRSTERSRPSVRSSTGYFRNKPYNGNKFSEYKRPEISSVREFRKHSVEIAKKQIYQHLSSNAKLDAERKKYEGRKGEKPVNTLDSSKRFGKWANEQDSACSKPSPRVSNAV